MLPIARVRFRINDRFDNFGARGRWQYRKRERETAIAATSFFIRIVVTRGECRVRIFKWGLANHQPTSFLD
jgi:hypothetical protein